MNLLFFGSGIFRTVIDRRQLISAVNPRLTNILKPVDNEIQNMGYWCRHFLNAKL